MLFFNCLELRWSRFEAQNGYFCQKMNFPVYGILWTGVGSPLFRLETSLGR